jgi:hypothetical protein
VAAPTIKTPPQSQIVDEGGDAEFKATAEGAKPLTFSWKRDEEDWQEGEPGDALESTHTIASVSKADNGAQIRVKVKDKDGNWSGESPPATLTVKSKEEVVLWVGPFARTAARAVAVAAIVVLVPLYLALTDVLKGNTDEAGFAAAIAVLLLAIGVFVVAAGIFLALLEFRGRARTLEELRDVLRAEAPEAEETTLSELLKALPDSLKAFGQLRATAALLAMAAVLFVCGTVIASNLADDSAGPSTTTGATTGPEGPTQSTP